MYRHKRNTDEDYEEAYIYIDMKFRTDENGDIDWDTESHITSDENSYDKVDDQWVFESAVEDEKFLNQLEPNTSYRCEIDASVPLEGYYYTDVAGFQEHYEEEFFECTGVDYQHSSIEDIRLQEV